MIFVGNGFGDVMIGRWAGLCVTALLLTGCVTDKVGTDYAATP